MEFIRIVILPIAFWALLLWWCKKDDEKWGTYMVERTDGHELNDEEKDNLFFQLLIFFFFMLAIMLSVE